MSKTYHNFFESKFKPLFFPSVKIEYSYGPFIKWPESMSYLAWQNLTRYLLWFIGKPKYRPNPQSNSKKKFSIRNKIRAAKQKSAHEKAVNNDLKNIVNELNLIEISDVTSCASNPIEHLEVQLELITILKQFLERKKITKIIGENVRDHRDQSSIFYSKQSLMLSALTVFLLRLESGNQYDTKTHDRDQKYSKANMAKFIDGPENNAPAIKTIENFLRNLDVNSINDMMIAFFKDLQKSKFFVQNPQVMPGDFFLLACDCVHTHTYYHPHHTDEEGNNDCGCCLKRVYNKGTKNEKTRWMHNTLVCSFVFMGKLKIPIYRHSIRAQQVLNLESASEETYKQECELVALKIALPIIREAFPKMKIVLLLDGLYANKPVIRLAEENSCGYIIVRQDGCLPILGKECDEMAETPLHKKNCVKRTENVVEEWNIKRKYEWFNSRYIGEGITTNVLRFSETRTKEGRKMQDYKGEWLFSWRLSAKKCEVAAIQARSRWEIEDLFNSLKNRGFKIKHDYSRHPKACFNWQGIALFAFGIFELFRFSENVKKKCDLPLIGLADKLERQLMERPTEEILCVIALTTRIQFRYHFEVKHNISHCEINEKDEPMIKIA